MTATFGDLLRDWRKARRFSQLDLSLEAETSARHLSFLESGRASPSRSMVLRLAAALDMPKAAANEALHAAGFAPAFPRYAGDAPDLAPVRAALETMLNNHDPLPAVVIDRRWDVTAANAGALRLFTALGLGGVSNMLEALIFAADGTIIENWEEIAFVTLHRARGELAHLGEDADLRDLVQRLSGHRRLAAADISAVNLSQAVVPTVLNAGADRLSLFSTLAQIGAAQDVHVSELRIELMFPTDAATRAWFVAGSS